MSPVREGESGEGESADAPTRVVVAAAVIRRGDRYLVGRRPSGKRHGGLWEFPGGKLGEGESFSAAVARELREELALQVEAVGRTLLCVEDPGTPFSIHFVEVSARGQPQALEHAELRWCDLQELSVLELAPADARFLVTALGVSGP